MSRISRKRSLALGIGHAVGLVGLRHPAAPDAEDQPAVAELVDRRRLLGQPQRMAQRQHLDGDADLDAPGARGDRAGDAERRRQQRAPRLEMQLGQPHHVEPPALGRVDLRHRLVERLALAPPRSDGNSWNMPNSMAGPRSMPPIATPQGSQPPRLAPSPGTRPMRQAHAHFGFCSEAIGGSDLR